VSINTIRLTQDVVNSRQRLTKSFIKGTITEAEARQLRRIFENERQMAIGDGNSRAVYSIQSWIVAVDDFLSLKRNIFISKIKVSNVT
jgi:hypothetical protein